MSQAARRIGILAGPGVQLLDVAGPLDVFAEANRQVGRQVYELLVLARRKGPITSSSGVRLMPDAVIGSDLAGPFDTLLVAGAPNILALEADGPLAEWLHRTVPATRRWGSVCTGAFFLATAGLLDGCRVSTHWAVAGELARRFPSIDVEADAIHVRDGKLRTAAGVTAGLDLALALVEEDHGRALAQKVAAELVMFFKRPGDQRQFSRAGEAAPAGRAALQEIQRWAAAHPAADLSVASLAARAGLSPRHFARLFQKEVGLTPAAWVEAARISAARHLLEGKAGAPKQVAKACGFSDPDTFRRAFLRQTGISPALYRRTHFQAEG